MTDNDYDYMTEQLGTLNSNTFAIIGILGSLPALLLAAYLLNNLGFQQGSVNISFESILIWTFIGAVIAAPSIIFSTTKYTSRAQARLDQIHNRL